MVSKSGGYIVPGVETKVSAMLSVGECSNLMLGVFDMMVDSRSVDGIVVDAAGVCCWGWFEIQPSDVCRQPDHGDRTLWPLCV